MPEQTSPRPAPATDEQVAAHVATAQPHTLVLLWRGPQRDQSEDEVERIQAAHLRHLVGLVRSGCLVVNGPVTDGDDLRGVSLYATADLDQVRAWVAEDPAVVSGRLRAEVRPWFGALPAGSVDVAVGDGALGDGAPGRRHEVT